ncbi:S-layer homology domain-containing protein [Paenibacillus filicis]|uniref:S-layer homology domain-containing protein n=1 Tax=Paenibacillus gyeongsangnamensis TaxID=3388067 RepID=A0ABT4QGH4_9BACL|nr:S-layer homology domain-containing protein [Paenibacillus filicis]MCZ8515978.1 S-layer homology domain-containing protein [Paenibacillus filicis]
MITRLALICVLAFAISNTVKAAGPAPLTDIQGHWAEQTIQRLVALGILDGFPDGTFRPNEPVTADQFVKMLLLSYTTLYPNGERVWTDSFLKSLSTANRGILQQDYRDFNFKPSLNGYWAKPFIDVASDLHLINKSQFPDFKAKLKREQVAEIVYYTMKETEYLEDEPLSLANARMLGDFPSAKEREQRFIAEAFGKGVMEGYPNRYFGIGQEVTRAEALAILERITDKSKRKSTLRLPNDPGLEKIVPTKDGGYKKVVFSGTKMAAAYQVLGEAAKKRGTNYDLVETTLKLYKDAETKAKDITLNVTNPGSWEEASLWIEPEYRTYGVTVKLQDGVLARNQEAIDSYVNYLFSYDAATFRELFNRYYSKAAAGASLENETVKIGNYAVEAHADVQGKTVVFSILDNG